MAYTAIPAPVPVATVQYELDRPANAQNSLIWRRTLAVIKPNYGWGETIIDRLDGDLGEGPDRWFSLAWLGLSFTIFYGRTPRPGQNNLGDGVGA